MENWLKTRPNTEKDILAFDDYSDSSPNPGIAFFNGIKIVLGDPEVVDKKNISSKSCGEVIKADKEGIQVNTNIGIVLFRKYSFEKRPFEWIYTND